MVVLSPAAPRWQLLPATERARLQRSGSDEAACWQVSISAPSGHLSEAPTSRAWLSFITMSRRPQPHAYVSREAVPGITKEDLLPNILISFYENLPPQARKDLKEGGRAEMDTSQQVASSLPLRCDRALPVAGSKCHRGAAGDNTTMRLWS
jgi:hypothetical protein